MTSGHFGGKTLTALVRWQAKRLERRMARVRPDDRLLHYLNSPTRIPEL